MLNTQVFQISTIHVPVKRAKTALFATLPASNSTLSLSSTPAAARVDDAIKELIDLLFQRSDLRLQRPLGLGSLRKAHVPSVAEHRLHQRKKPV